MPAFWKTQCNPHNMRSSFASILAILSEHKQNAKSTIQRNQINNQKTYLNLFTHTKRETINHHEIGPTSRLTLKGCQIQTTYKIQNILPRLQLMNVRTITTQRQASLNNLYL